MDGSDLLVAGDLKLANVDIQDQHLYPWPVATPMGTSTLESDASQTAAAGQALVIGEYAWNGSTDLAPFLSAIESNTNISGDMYWDLLPPNNDFDFEEDFDGYQLHFPGDNSDVIQSAGVPPVLAASSDAPLVTELRNHAYAMTGTAVPAYAVPTAPVITNVEHVTGAISGSGNIVEWRGGDGAATYLVSRSTAGATGPWTEAGSISATWQEPWLDSGGPAGPNVWYEVAGVNSGGVAGPDSAAFQMQDLTLDDNAADFSLTYTHSADVTIDTASPALYAGDTARMAFLPGEAYAYVVWQAAGPISTIEALAYNNPNSDALTIQVSADDATWVNVPASDVQVQPLLVGASSDDTEVIYTIEGVQSLLPGARYVSVLRGANSAGTAELGEIRINYAPPG
jgi:hypothetical protein